MKLTYDAGAFILAAGQPHHLLELALAGGDVPTSKGELAAALAAAQNADGSCSGSLDAGKAGSVPFTARLADLLTRAGAPDAAQKGARWLAASQRPDGGFSENPALADTLKPDWDWFSTTNAVTWITGEAMLALAAVGGYAPALTRARNLLFRARNRDGGWPGQIAADYPDRTDLWAVPTVVRGLMAVGVPANHDVFRGVADALTRQRDRWRNPVENPLPALLALGRRLTDADVQDCLRIITDTQNADGGWPYLAGGESHPDPSVSIIALLARYGLKSGA